MRNLYLTLAITLFHQLTSFGQAPTDLFISEYVEGTSNNKAIEIRNGTGAAIDLTAGNYVIQMYFNGSSTASLTINLNGTVAANGVFVLAQGSASFASAPYVNQINSSAWFNGNDAVALKKGGAAGTILDVIGQVGFNPGTEWGTGLASTADNTLRRKSSICSGDTNPSDVFDPSQQWDGFSTDDFSGLGAHTSSCSVSSGILLAPVSLSFTATVDSVSAEQSYSIRGNALTSDIAITAPANFGVSAVSGGPYSGSLVISAAAADTNPVNVYVVYKPSLAGMQTGSISHTSGTDTAGLTVKGSAVSATVIRIYTIQGSGGASSFDGSTVTTEGLVTADFQGSDQLKGFYLQDTAGDGNTSTSDGIFVFDTSFQVNVGDYVKLAGEVDEYFNLTEIKNVSSLSVLSSDNALMGPANLSLPVASVTDFEKYEGMLVRFPQTLTVTETFTLGRFGELSLSADGRLFNPTNFVDPNDEPPSGTTSSGNSNVAAVTAQQDLNNRRRILLDDGSNVQNPPVVPFLNPADATLRCGTTVDSLTGILDYSFSTYRIQPAQAPAFDYAVRPAAPVVEGNVKVASFNVLNYFNGNGSGGGFPTPRGANTLIEFNRQRVKIIAAIKNLNADVVGLTEIENDGDGPSSAIADLVEGLNDATSDSTYAYIPDPSGANGNTGTDAIKVAMIYKAAKLTPVGLAKADTSPVHNRPPLAQTFTLNSNGDKFTVIINHFKSKSCTDATGANLDQGDGQGCYNDRRKSQATALISFIAAMQAASGDSDIISVGDYNAYDQEDPLDTLRVGGLTDILPDTYSYVFDGQSGSLDHALVTQSAFPKLAGATKWHINADEPVLKDYNQEFNPPYVYSPDAFRSSDHDPVLAGFQLQSQNQLPQVIIESPVASGNYQAGDSIVFRVGATDPDGNISRVEFFEHSNKLGTDSVAPYEFSAGQVDAGQYVISALAFDNNGDSAVSDTLTITVSACTGSGSILGEGYTDIAGPNLSALNNSPKFPNNPDVVVQLNRFEYGPNVGDNYGARVRGYLCAPRTGNYVFYLSGDDASELWLSTDSNSANRRRIAYADRPTGFRNWFTYPTQHSVPVRLFKGARYYIESLHKEGTGSDYLSVGWVLPSGVFEAPIPGSYLSPSPSAASSTSSASTFEEAFRNIEGKKSGFTVSVTPNPSADVFRISITSSQQQSVSMLITDVSGRTVERRAGVPANGILTIGEHLRPGLYFVQLVQGDQSRWIKLFKQ